jgi:hypothetical protein
MIRVVILFVALTSCALGNKVNYEHTRTERSDKKYTAVLFSKMPSYATKTAYHITLKKKTRGLRNKENGNIFIAESKFAGKPLTDAFRIRWVNTDSLEISYSSTLVIKKQVFKRNGITILYVPI